jgi:DNA polymerase III epsilon subunit-like protein
MSIFKLRRELANKHTAVRLLLWVSRQTAKSPKTSLDKLCRRLNLLDPKGRNVQRAREDALKAFATLRDLGVVETFDYDPKTDFVVVTKADDWHFPAGEEDEEGLLEG